MKGREWIEKGKETEGMEKEGNGSGGKETTHTCIYAPGAPKSQLGWLNLPH